MSKQGTFTKSAKPNGGFGEKMGYKENAGHGGKKSYGNKDSDYNSSGLKVQRGPDWIESSDFCRTNIRTGEVKWKEEFSTGNSSGVHMHEPRTEEGRGLGFSVPSTWKFQNVSYGKYECKCGQTYCYEAAMRIHSKSCTRGSH
jgi:hypothetical protein